MSEKILVINDDDGIRELTQLLLQSKGYETFEAENGKKGVDAAIQIIPDLILLDIMMPVMDGYETCKQLKANPVTKDIPIIFLSSLNTSQEKIKGLELGAVDFIHNVVDQGELLARVQTHLKIQFLTKELIKKNEQLVKKQQDLDDNLNAAAIIQSSFLPQVNMKFSNIEIGWIWLPSYTLGGDIFNVIQVNDKVIFYIVDVSGHDVPSALVTVSVSQFLHQQNASSSRMLTPKQMMIELDKEYPIERFDRFFTIFYGIFDLSTNILSYSSAGHPPVVILRKNNELKVLEQRGTIIGLNIDYPFQESSEVLEKGDRLFLYTDGILELKNDQEELYGAEKLRNLLKKVGQHSMNATLSAVRQSMDEFKGKMVTQDDISMMVVEVK